MVDNDLIDRNTYRAIKKMSREQISEYLRMFGNNVLASHSTTENDLANIKQEIGELKGIGEKRLEDIMNIIEKYV